MCAARCRHAPEGGAAAGMGIPNGTRTRLPDDGEPGEQDSLKIIRWNG